LNQETKHIYILQNSLRKSNNGTLRKSGVTLAPTIYIVNSSHSNILKDRIDDDRNLEYKENITVENFDPETRTQPIPVDDLEPKTRNIQTFKIPDRDEDRLRDINVISTQDQRRIGNHAMIYRVR
jgi:hypothetical protein